MKINRTGIVIKPDPTRVLIRPFQFGAETRSKNVILKVLALTERTIELLLNELMQDFEQCHKNITDFFLKRFEDIKYLLPNEEKISMQRKLLIGAYFSNEYSLESAALFNPSMVWHPDQNDLPDDCKRFILSFRATGEGHISSITFRTGMIKSKNKIEIDECTRFVNMPEMNVNHLYDKSLFTKKINEANIENEFSNLILDELRESFKLSDLKEKIDNVIQQTSSEDNILKSTAERILALAQANYEINFANNLDISERVIFPMAPAESNGIEDVRFVKFTEDDGSIIYYGTYTAYDGKKIVPQFLETKDFLNFKIFTFNGSEAVNKGFALFPRKINGKYAMISRQDGENIFIMFSDDLHIWTDKEILVKPVYHWEFVQLGNCGSPIETEAGWIVLSHGVGALRKYTLGAFLLDLNDPTKIIGRLNKPLLTPNQAEREGYVPNVVYSCGGLIYHNELIIPYAMSDYASSIFTVNLDELLNELIK